MHNPFHPGETIKELCLEPLDISVTEAAQALGVSRKTLSAILNGRAGISPEMAVAFLSRLIPVRRVGSSSSCSMSFGMRSSIGRSSRLKSWWLHKVLFWGIKKAMPGSIAFFRFDRSLQVLSTCNAPS